MNIILIVIAVIVADVIIDSLILKKMGYSPLGVIKAAWHRLTSRRCHDNE